MTTIKKHFGTTEKCVLGLLVLFLSLLFTFPTREYSYLSEIHSTERAKDIAHAVLMYKNKTGTVPDFDKPGWPFLIKEFLGDETKASITSQGQIRDSKGNLYEINRHNQSIDIFSYSMIDPIRIDLESGTIASEHRTFLQSMRLIFR